MKRKIIKGEGDDLGVTFGLDWAAVIMILSREKMFPGRVG